jgi:hypothetical protein
MVYDVTDVASTKKALEKANEQLENLRKEKSGLKRRSD